MSKFEYKAVPAPTRGTKARGAKSTEDRFALSITETLNDMASDGWEYVRAETLPCDERKGLTGTQTTYQNILIFKRFKQVSQPLTLDARTTSRPLPMEVDDTTATQDYLRPVSEPVVPRRVTTRPPEEENNAPPLGAARED
ncbi:MAG: DUF4177 domain-containing protein [Silicimonas sp.]